jgi:hypothetical protein
MYATDEGNARPPWLGQGSTAAVDNYGIPQYHMFLNTAGVPTACQNAGYSLRIGKV